MESTKHLSDILGFKKSLSAFEIIDIARKGIKVSTAKKVIDQIEINQEELAEYSGINKRTLSRRFRESAKSFTPEESEKIIRLAKVYTEAVDVFDEQSKALEWLKRPNKALKNELPISLLDSEFGAEQVLNVLGRIREGVYN